MIKKLAIFAACFSIALAANGSTATTMDMHQLQRQISENVVTNIATVRPGDMVLIVSSPQNMELMEDLATDVNKAGGYAIVSVGSDRMVRMYFDKVPVANYGVLGKTQAKLAGLVDVLITIDYESNPAIFQDIPASRQLANAKSFLPVTTVYNNRGVREINIGNALYPSKYTAAQYGVTLDQLRTVFLAGMNADYAVVRANGRAVKAALANSSTVHVTAPNGTDLTFSVKGRPITVSDSRLNSANHKPGTANIVFMPAGEVIPLIVPGSAKGTVAFGPVWYNNVRVVGMKMNFANGVMTSWSATSGLDAVKAFYDKGGTGRNAFTYFDVGINPAIQRVIGSAMWTYAQAGMVSMGTGGDVFFGGSNASPFAFASYVLNATVTVDGKPIVKNGTLTI